MSTIQDRPITSTPLHEPSALGDAYLRVRRFSDDLCEPLATEDFVVQSMPDASPAKWHLAHTTWFFETFLLKPHAPGYKPKHHAFEYLFNSYYNSVGEQFPRPRRGLITRPTVAEVKDYRAQVDEAMVDFFEQHPETVSKLAAVVVLGLNHEQQHQELILTDLKHALAQNPLFPVYREQEIPTNAAVCALDFDAYEGGIHSIGFEGDGFSFDNEGPRHEVLLRPYKLANRLVTNREYIEFMEDGGYSNPLLWLSEGWATVQQEGWDAPLYWHRGDDGWDMFTLTGLRPAALDEPVCHVSYFEADAFARWAQARLATEQEWECAAAPQPIQGNFVEAGHWHTAPADGSQFYGDVWEWTASQYTAYPGFCAAEGALGEYNGKFMCNQFVLRGGSCATAADHIRPAYRNFFPPSARWQFSGIRIAKDDA